MTRTLSYVADNGICCSELPLVAETVAEQGSNSDATGSSDFEEAAARTGGGQRDRWESSRETSGQSSHGKGDSSVETAAYRDHQATL
jgi:hypothetical protein